MSYVPSHTSWLAAPLISPLCASQVVLLVCLSSLDKSLGFSLLPPPATDYSGVVQGDSPSHAIIWVVGWWKGQGREAHASAWTNQLPQGGIAPPRHSGLWVGQLDLGRGYMAHTMHAYKLGQSPAKHFVPMSSYESVNARCNFIHNVRSFTMCVEMISCRNEPLYAICWWNG